MHSNIWGYSITFGKCNT